MSEHKSRTPIEGYRARYKPIAKTRHCVFTRLRDIRDASRADWLRPGNCNCLQAQPNLQRMLKESLWILDRHALLFLVFFCYTAEYRYRFAILGIHRAFKYNNGLLNCNHFRLWWPVRPSPKFGNTPTLDEFAMGPLVALPALMR